MDVNFLEMVCNEIKSYERCRTSNVAALSGKMLSDTTRELYYAPWLGSSPVSNARAMPQNLPALNITVEQVQELRSLMENSLSRDKARVFMKFLSDLAG